ncbi:MAG: pyridoxamine 5'-phosphate oxidase family protein [Nitrococcus sp.]|nr:pyridoxamine 5'-phosphate oxidase family protein [Nitrococcus sp.]
MGLLKPEWTADEILGELTALRESQRSVILATLGAGAYPEASYAPYVCDEWNNFYIFVSRLARHTESLEADRKASLLFIEPEHLTRQIFARRRLTYRCDVQPIGCGTAQWRAQLSALQRRFGTIVESLSRLPDFRLFRLVPFEGRFVRGFGQAFQWTRDQHHDRWRHIGPDNRQ